MERCMTRKKKNEKIKSYVKQQYLVLTSMAEFDPGDTLFDACSNREDGQQNQSKQCDLRME